MDNDSSTSASRIDLQTAKRELLAKLLKKEGIDLHNSHKIYPRQGYNNTPLSFAQERLWFLDQLEPGNSVYNICRAQRLTGPLDLVILTQSINEIVRRHEILRTTFPCVAGVPSQVATPTFTLAIPVVNLQELPPSIQGAETSRIAVEEAQCTFNLAMGPLIRAKLLQLGEERHVLLLTTHQIVCDGWSIGVFFRELSNLYLAYSSGNGSRLEDLPIQYADFAAWQRQWLQGEVLETQISYWQKQLGHSLPTLGISTDGPRPAVQSFRGAREPVVLSEDLAKAVKILSQRAGVTPFMTLLAVFKTLLYRYTGQEDLLVGCPFAGRHHLETENLIGSFVNTLVLRTNLHGDPPFNELLSRIRDTCLGAYAHQDLPFEKLVMEFEVKRDLSRNPVFQAMFAFQNRSVSSLNLSGLTSEPIEVDTETSKFDFTLSLTDRGNDLAGFFEYNTDLFNRSTIERMIGHFRMLLEGILADSVKPISALTLLTEAERHQVLVKWNETQADYPKDSCIHELFEVQVERTPEAIAVQFEGKQLTYRELNNRANQVAHYLQGLGVGPEKLVGICVERSLEMVVGLLGVLKAGGAYVPLDPIYPTERLRFMLEDAQVSVLITQEKLVEDRGWRMEDGGPRETVVCVDRDWIAQQRDDNPNSAVASENLVYVIYTSGSAGQPKGVQIEHRALVNCLHSIAHRLGFTDRDVSLTVTTISFDIAALELFLPLIIGGKVVVARRDQAVDGRELASLLTNSSATALQATPSTWRLLIDAGWEGSPGFKILCGGEPMPKDLAEVLLTFGEVWNLYGPTESTIWSTAHKVEPSVGPVPIGRPIANTKIYILDSHLQPVPIGVHGELYIGGDGLARSYRNQPELTAEKFVLNPFMAGERLYRTGDRARYLPNGHIEFIERMDNQVKIRGYRVELGEVESALNQHPAVRESVTVIRDRGSSGDKELVAYVVPQVPSALSVTELRNFLEQKLPQYMIPSGFVTLEALPRNPNGKVDRNALPPDSQRPLLDQGFVEPRTEIEELVARVWREVLKLKEVGVYDNFFKLGGHSLLATRVISRIRDLFHIDMPLRTVFQAPTIVGLAQAVVTAQQKGLQVVRTPILPVGREKPVLPSVAQEPLLGLERLFPGAYCFNIPAAYRLKGVLDVNALKRSLNAVVERHEALRTTFPTVSGRQVQFIVSSLSITLEVVDLERLPELQRESEAKRLAREEVETPFDLAAGPLLRVKLLKLNDRDHVILVTMHHIISDGWSMIIFFRDLAQFYEASLNGHDPSLPELPIQYADFSEWQRQALEGQLMKNQLVYWKQQLDRPLSRFEFSTGRPRMAELSFLAARKSLSITGDLVQSLKKLSQREEGTLFTTLLTALKVLLYFCTGEKDIRVGTLVENRNRRETENLIGHFANTLIIRSKVSPSSNFRQLAREVRDITLAAQAHQDLPFEVLAQAWESDKNLDRASLCQTVFIYQTSPLYPIKLPGLTVDLLDDIKRVEEPEIAITTFDLILAMKEKPAGIVGSLIYKVDVLDEAVINRTIAHFYTILRRVISKPNQPVSELCRLEKTQR